MIKRGIVVTSFGDRTLELQGIVKNIKKFTDIPLVIYVDKLREGYPETVDYKIVDSYLWRESSRWGVRQSNYWKAKAILQDERFHSFCCLDDDMRIVNESFADGFALSERLGICVPINPRIYVKMNALGSDVSAECLDELKELPQHAPACNLSPIFACRSDDCYEESLLRLYIKELITNPCRGTVAFWKVCWKSRILPLFLPEQWCVCGSNAEYIKNYVCSTGKVDPIMLHYGHEKVREVFPGY